MSNTMTSQCPNCQRWFSNKCSLRIHIQSCRAKHTGEEDRHDLFQHYPLKSSHFHNNAILFNNDSLSDLETSYSKQDQSDDDDVFPIDSRACLDDYDGGCFF
jgi:hypothetical protein